MGLDGLRAYIRKHIQLADYFVTLISKDDRFEIAFPAAARLGLVCFRIKNSSNELNEQLLKALNDDKRIYLVRLAICSWLTEEKHVKFAWDVIDQVTTKLLRSK